MPFHKFEYFIFFLFSSELPLFHFVCAFNYLLVLFSSFFIPPFLYLYVSLFLASFQFSFSLSFDLFFFLIIFYFSLYFLSHFFLALFLSDFLSFFSFSPPLFICLFYLAISDESMAFET